MDLKAHTVISAFTPVINTTPTMEVETNSTTTVSLLLEKSGHNTMHPYLLLLLIALLNHSRTFSRLSSIRTKPRLMSNRSTSSSKTAVAKMVKSGSKLIFQTPPKLLVKSTQRRLFLQAPLLQPKTQMILLTIGKMIERRRSRIRKKKSTTGPSKWEKKSSATINLLEWGGTVTTQNEIFAPH
jgi:hypothetical protein